MADEVKIDEEGLRRSARSQIIVDTIERSLEKMIFVESNLGKEMEPQDLFQVRREAVAAVAEVVEVCKLVALALFVRAVYVLLSIHVFQLYTQVRSTAVYC